MNKDNKNKGKPPMARPHRIPKEYLEAVADRIHSTAPTKEQVTKTLLKVASLFYTKGYARRMADAKLFKEKQKAHFEEAWKHELTAIDDLIHPEKREIKKPRKRN